MSQSSTFWSRSLILLLITSFMCNMIHYMLFSTVGIYAKGFTSIEYYIGFVASAFTIAALCSKLFTGKLFDLFATKKVLLAGCILTFFASVGYILADNIQLLIIVRAVNGLGFGITTVSIATMIADAAPKEKLTQAVGYNMMMMTLSTAVGPTLALSITQSDASKFMPIFIMIFAVAFVALICALPVKTISSVTVTDVTDKGNPRINLATVIFSSIAFLCCFAQSSIVAYINLYALEVGLGNMTPYFLTYAVSNIMIRMAMGGLLRRFTHRQLLFGCGVLALFVFAGIYVAKSALPIYLLGFVYGISIGVFYPVINTRVLRSMSQRKKGIANSVYLASCDVAQILGITTWSAVATYIGSYHYIYLIAILITMVYLFVLTVYPVLLRKFGVPEETEW